MGIARLLLSLMLVSTTLAAAPKTPTDAETIKLLKRAYSPRVDPSTEIPRYPEYSTWTATSAVMGQTDASKPVPLYDIQGINLIQIGEVPSGTEVTLDQVTSFAGRNFYRYSLPAGTGNGRPLSGWLDGLFIVRDDAKSWKP